MAKILVIDDDAQIRGLIKQILEREQHDVVEACNGSEGVEASSVQPFDLVLSDLVMPGKDGLTAIQEMLKANPVTKIIAMSGGASGNAAWLPIAKRAGAMKLLKKPFSPKALVEIVTESLHEGIYENY